MCAQWDYFCSEQQEVNLIEALVHQILVVCFVIELNAEVEFKGFWVKVGAFWVLWGPAFKREYDGFMGQGQLVFKSVPSVCAMDWKGGEGFAG